MLLTSKYSEAVDQQKLDSIILVPLAILDFLCVHPFTEGKGRMSRLLTLMLLYQFDYQVGHFISLEGIFEESKESYYETLEASSQAWHEGKHDVNPWLNYFWGTVLRAYREFEERVGIISNRASKTELIGNTINRRVGQFSIGAIESDCHGISREMIRLVTPNA
jgi:Fic family protein